MEVVLPPADGGDEDHIPGDLGVELTHAVEPQDPLGLLQAQLQGQAQPQELVPVGGMGFSGQELIAVFLGQIRPEEHLLALQALSFWRIERISAVIFGTERPCLSSSNDLLPWGTKASGSVKHLRGTGR